MITVKCIAKKRNKKGRVQRYIIQDQNGQTKELTGHEIKELIRSECLDVVNLQIDKAGRLVYKAEPKQRESAKKEKPIIVHQSAPQQKKKSPKEIVKNFLSKMDARYEDRYVDYRFINDYNSTWIDVLNGNEQPMPPEVKKYFKSLIDCIVKQVRESSVYIYDPYEENVTNEEFLRNSKLPEKVVKFMQTTKCNKGIIKGLAFLAAEEEGIAQISVVPTGLVDEGTEPIIITANYDIAKKHIKDSIETIKEWLTDGWDEEVTEEKLIDNIDIEGNKLADIWFIKYLSELDGKTIDDYKEKLLELIKIKASNNGKFGLDLDAIRYALWDWETLTYMILKYGVMRYAHDDYNDEYESAVKKEAAILYKELLGKDI